MKKIPTMFVRDQKTHLVVDVVTPGCEWVAEGEGVARRKYDGTCRRFEGIGFWERRTVKPGKPIPADFEIVDYDEVTGQSVGWVPWTLPPDMECPPHDGTYELCGPKVNGNPEGFEVATLVEHATATIIDDLPRDYEGLREYMRAYPHEGVVFWHPDGRMAKIKRRDFGR